MVVLGRHGGLIRKMTYSIVVVPKGHDGLGDYNDHIYGQSIRVKYIKTRAEGTD